MICCKLIPFCLEPTASLHRASNSKALPLACTLPWDNTVGNEASVKRRARLDKPKLNYKKVIIIYYTCVPGKL